MKLRAFILAALLIFASACPHGRAQSSAPPVDLALVLAVDASGSVNQTRFDLQKQHRQL
jgi:hypothetical protein